MSKIRVIIAEDHAIVRQGLKILIQEDPSMEVAGEARTGRDAVALAKELQPDVVVMDVAMPVLNGIEATRALVSERPQSRVLVLSSYAGDDCVRESLKAGAVGYVTKHAASDELLKAIRDVYSGGSYFSPDVARRLRNHLRRTSLGIRASKPVTLSEREREVLCLIAQGLPNKQIADVLGISIKTVEKHRQQLIDKLDIHDTAGLTRYAVDAGLVGAGTGLPPRANQLPATAPGLVR